MIEIFVFLVVWLLLMLIGLTRQSFTIKMLWLNTAVMWSCIGIGYFIGRLT